MLTCENCGKSFERPADQLLEVTTLRVLCSPCSAARAAAKARKASSAVRPGSEARLAPPSSTSIPAKKVQARPEPELASVRPRSSPPSASTTGSSTGSSARMDRPTPKDKKKKKKIDVETLASKKLQKRGTREILVAFGAAALVFAVAGFVLWKVLGQKAAEQAEFDRIQAALDGFRNEFRSIDITTEEGAQHLIEFGEENRPIWGELDELGTEVVSRSAKAKDFLAQIATKRELMQRLEAIEQVMARAAELPPSELAEQLRRMDELKPKAGIVGAEFEARLDRDRAEGERVHMERLMATGEDAAATTPPDRTALTTLQQVEDDVHRIFEGVYKLWDKNKQDPALSEKKKTYEDNYKHIIELSDDVVERFFSADVVEALPWRDLLADPSAWKTGELKGYEHKIESGMLHLIGPDPSEGGQAVMSIGDKEVWRDFVVEMEFTLMKGYCELYFRLSPVWQKNVESRELTTDEGFLEAERTYTYVYSVIGSRLVEEQKGEDSPGPDPRSISWTQIRKGGFGISVPKNTEIKFTKLRAKVLR